MLKHFAMATAISAAMATGVWADKTDSKSGSWTDQAAGKAAAAMDQTQDQQWSQQYLRDLASENQLEINLGQRVAKETQDPQVRQFAQMMAQEHQQAKNQIDQTARQMNVNVSNEPDRVGKAIEHKFSQFSGKQLDRQYMLHEISSHQKAWIASQYTARNSTNPQVQKLASQMAQSLQQHYQHAQQLAQAEFGTTGQPALMGQPPLGNQHKSGGSSGTGNYRGQ